LEDGVLILAINADNNMNIDAVMYKLVWSGPLSIFGEFLEPKSCKGDSHKEITANVSEEQPRSLSLVQVE
jgi:hypothetical protein